MRTIAVTSGKGGVGKSCSTAYTGAALAKAGKKTLLVELGANFKSLDLIVGAKSVYDIVDVFAGRCDPKEAIVPSSLFAGLDLLPGGICPPAAASHSDLHALLKSLKGQYEYVLLDGVDFSLYPVTTPHTICIVTTPDCLCVRACSQQATELYGAGASNLRLIINRVPPKILPMRDMRDFDDIIDQIGVQLLGVIPESPKLQFSSNNSEIIDEQSLTTQVFENIAARLLGKRCPLMVY